MGTFNIAENVKSQALSPVCLPQFLLLHIKYAVFYYCTELHESPTGTQAVNKNTPLTLFINLASEGGTENFTLLITEHSWIQF